MIKLKEDWTMIDHQEQKPVEIKERSPSPQDKNLRTPRPRLKSLDIVDLYRDKNFEFDSNTI